MFTLFAGSLESSSYLSRIKQLFIKKTADTGSDKAVNKVRGKKDGNDSERTSFFSRSRRQFTNQTSASGSARIAENTLAEEQEMSDFTLNFGLFSLGGREDDDGAVNGNTDNTEGESKSWFFRRFWR